MRRSIWKRIEEILQKHVLHGKWVRAVIALACVVIYITTYVLIMPAVTMARATDCGQEEHTHSGDCYETETELTCGREEHTHTDDCYDEEGNLICGMEEHVHDDSCYTSREVLVCGQEEHVHTEDCYAEEEVIQEDIQEEAEEGFVSENEEEQPEAEDTDIEQVGTAAPEQLSQIRFKEYLTDWTTIYYVPEDGDNWQPLAEDKWHSLYEDNWGIRRNETEDRGLDPEEEVLLHIGYRIPAGQINATNPQTEFILPLSINMTEEEVRDNNNNNYTLFSGTDREENELFVDGEYEIVEEWNSDGEVTLRKLVITLNEDACLRCGGEKLTDGTETLAPQELEGFFELRVKAEDLLTLEKKSESTYVLEWNDEEELDTTVCFDPEKLAAYYDAKNGESAETEVEKPASGELRAEGEDYTITVSYTEEAGLPAGVSLKVKEITKEKEYESYKAQMEEELIDSASTKVTGVRFFDITLEDSEGNELHPESGVRVMIETKDTLKENEKVQICHFDEEKDKPVEVESREVTNETYEEENLGVEFEAESFSVYGVVYTVDFEYSVNGKMYQFSFPGGGFVSFTDLVEVLGITSDTNSEENRDENGSVSAENAEENVANEGAEENGVNSDTNTPLTIGDVEVSEVTRKFVGDVASVEFSSPELVDVSKVDADTTVGQIKKSRGLKCQYSAELTEEQITEINAQTVEAGDWALISVLPFMSDETLTITMTDGEVFMIKVTDAQISKTVIDARGDTWEITVTYDEDAQIPEGAELKVSEILPEDVKYIEYYRKATDLVCEDEAEGNRHGYGRLFDISIWNGKEEIEPQSNVEVSIKLANAPEDSNELRVVHFGKLEPEVMLLEETPERDSLNTNETVVDKKETVLRFETDSFSVYAVVSTNTSDGTGLGGQKFAIVNPNGTRGEAVLGRSQENNTALSASEVTIQQISGQTYLVGGEVSVWEFENVNNNNYYIKAPNGQYMNLGNGTAFLSATPQVITVSRSGNGLRLANNGYGLNAWNRNVSQGFRAGTYNDDASRFTLYGVNELIQNQAEKISLTDLVDLHDGETPVDEVVIYTRILNQERDGYDYYAVTADGSLAPVFDIGDTIGWVSANDTPEHLKWKLTVHSSGGVNNGYFDFQSMENGLYLIPTEPNGLKTDDPEDSWDLGVNMQGWNNGTYGSFIERWNADIREYVGYGYDAVNKKIVPTADDSQKLEFLFAHVKEDTAPNQLHTVDTLDGKTKGITIKMYDFNGSSLNPSFPPRSSEMTTVMGRNSTTSTNVDGVGYANSGLVSQTLTDGFPIAMQTNRSLSQLFNDSHFKSDASNIFVRQVYDETGYFSYDSSKNYAYLDQEQNQFILYRELAAPAMEGDTTPSANKGNFFPFDSLQDLADQNQVFTNRFVKFDGDLHEMTPDNPQYGETLYKIANGDTNNYSSYFFGMTMEAHFYQGRDGKDEWGNDIIYEFNGDDDMWLYIDDRLVLDIGGCHGAVSGTVNFATGEVRVNGSRNQVRTTLKEIFQNAGKLPDGTNWTTEGAQKWFRENTFADYTQHSFKMFYMERGAYASNLKMKFNLITIEPGSFVLEKKLPDEVQSYGEQTFAYQIYTVSDGHETLYTPPEGKQVTYEKSGEPVPINQEGNSGFKSTYTIGDITYGNVYLLKPYEPIVIPTVSNDVRYFIREIGIDADRYEIVKANSIVLQDTKQNPAVDLDNNRTTATTDIDSVRARGRVTYENIPKETHNLRLEKLLQGPAVNPDDSFRFDVQLEDSVTGQLIPYYMGEYYIVKTDDGGVDHYYKYENGTLVQSSEPVAYKAGVSGSIDHIIPGYTILITGLLPGTDFQVTENLSAGEYPEGYLYAGKSVQNAGDPEFEGSDGRISARGEGGNNDGYHDALVQITNISGTDINLMKVDKNDLGETDPDCLKGASFTLSKYTDSTFQSKDVNWGDNGSKTLKDEKNPNGTYTLNGVFEFEQLTVGYYKIEEIEFPAGYVKLTDDPTFKVELDDTDGFTITLIKNPDNLLRLVDGELTIIVGNPPGVALPNAGGPGTTLFTSLGAMLIALAGAGLVWMRKRRSAA